jgi:hypothetical protein
MSSSTLANQQITNSIGWIWMFVFLITGRKLLPKRLSCVTGCVHLCEFRKRREAANLQREGIGCCCHGPTHSERGDPWSSKQQLESNIWVRFSDVPMSASTFHRCALLCEVRMHLLGHCWMCVAQSYILWAAVVTSRDMSKDSSQGPSWQGSLTGQLRSLRPPRIHAGERPAGTQCMILQASHTRAGPHSPADSRTFTV